MGFESKCSILNGQVIYIEKSKLKIADMWLNSLDRVTIILSEEPRIKSSDILLNCDKTKSMYN